MDYKYSAIVLGNREIGETDRIYSFLTAEKGKVRAIGRGTRKPVAKLAGNLESLTQVEIFIHKTKGLGNISGVISVNSFSKLKENIDALEELLSISNILERIIQEEQKEEKVYAYFESFLNLAEKSVAEKKMIDFRFLKTGFLIKVFEELGYRLEVDKCVECGNNLTSGENYFDFSQGGIFCSQCKKNKIGGRAVSDDLIKAIRIILNNKLESLIKLKLGNQEKNSLEKLVESFYQWIWG